MTPARRFLDRLHGNCLTFSDVASDAGVSADVLIHLVYGTLFDRSASALPPTAEAALDAAITRKGLAYSPDWTD